jgi:hypothetical protein
MNLFRVLPFGLIVAAGIFRQDGLRTQSFDQDPDWDGHQNRLAEKVSREVKQDFGWSRTAHAGGASGEVGGLVSPAWEPAYYAKKIPATTFDQRLTASGTLNCTGRKFHVLLGFFNSGTLGAWRAPNSISLRLQGRGDHFYCYVEYATARFRAGGDSPKGFAQRDPATERLTMRHFPLGKVIRWTLEYDPAGNGGKGTVNVTLDGQEAVCNLGDGHKQDGARFDRFGLQNVMKSVDDAGEVWFDDVTVQGERDDFSRDPKWEGVGNRRAFTSKRVRPAFDYGWSPTNYAGGKGPGELGGINFRGDGRYADKIGYYGDRLETLDLTKPIRASGRICLRRAASDSTTLIGFFHSKESATVRDEQKSSWPYPFVGAVVEGPSPEGFFLYPAHRLTQGEFSNSRAENSPYIYPDGRSHAWTLEYTPGSPGMLRVTLDGKGGEFKIDETLQRSGARFDRFGIISTVIDGNGQEIYFDDLTYTCKQP